MMGVQPRELDAEMAGGVSDKAGMTTRVRKSVGHKVVRSAAVQRGRESDICR